MFRKLKKAFTFRDLRDRILITLGILVLYRAMAAIPISTFTLEEIATLRASTLARNTLFKTTNLFSGEALASFSVVGLGLIPYFGAWGFLSSVLELFPSIGKSRDDREFPEWFRRTVFYLTIPSAIIQAVLGEAILLPRMGLQGRSLFLSVVTIAVVTAGAMLVTWMSMIITERGFGNGISLMIFVNLIASSTYLLSGYSDWRVAVAVTTVLIILIPVTVFVTKAERRVTVAYAKRKPGRFRTTSATYIPYKLIPGAIDPISTVVELAPIFTLAGLGIGALIPGFSLSFDGMRPLVQTLLVFAAIGAATFFLTILDDSSEEQAANMQKLGGFLPGVRQGEPTVEALRSVQRGLRLPAAVYFAVIGSLPWLLMLIPGVDEPAIILLGVANIVNVVTSLDLELRSEMIQRGY